MRTFTIHLELDGAEQAGLAEADSYRAAAEQYVSDVCPHGCYAVEVREIGTTLAVTFDVDLRCDGISALRTGERHGE